jgi:hypothetical protein
MWSDALVISWNIGEINTFLGVFGSIYNLQILSLTLLDNASVNKFTRGSLNSWTNSSYKKHKETLIKCFILFSFISIIKGT